MYLSFILLSVLTIGSFASRLNIRDNGLPARVPYIFPPPGTDPIADAFRARRVNGTLLDLDGALLNSPLFAEGWNDLAGIVRDNSTLPPPMRELFILRTGVLTNSSYVWLQHESVGRAAGLTTDQLLIIRLAPAFLVGADVSDILGPSLTAALAFTDWITKSIRVPVTVFDDLRKYLNDDQLVEATITSGFYNLVGRFVVALNIDQEMDVVVPIPH